jgi:hypothetical protein
VADPRHPGRKEDSDQGSDEDAGTVLFRENGGSWWVVSIGPLLIAAVVAVEATGPGQIHWPVLSIFFVVLTGFALIQVYAARQHVSVCLTETTLRQGVKTIPLTDIEKIHPENNAPDPKDWESASALGELSGVPRRRTGIGLTLTSGKLTQAWARDHRRLRQELTEALLAVQMGLGPRGGAERNPSGPDLTKPSDTTPDLDDSDETS